MRKEINEKKSDTTTDYNLSIRVSSDGLYIAVQDQSNTVLMSRSVSAPVFSMSCEEIIELFYKEKSVIESDYTDILLIVESNQYVFVPEPIFDIHETDTYFYFEHKEDKNDVVLFNRITEWDTVNIFSMPLALNQALGELFPDSAITHQASHLLYDKVSSKEDYTYVWVRPVNIDVIAINEGKLTLINTFEYRSGEDVSYYILSLFEQLNLNIETTTVKLFQRDKDNNLRKTLSEYVKKCIIVTTE